MKRPHLVGVEGEPAAFAGLFRAAAAAGVEVGWLEPAAGEDPWPAPVPPSLAAAAEQGALRAVAVGPGGSVGVKPRSGLPVLDDLLREHFLGCRLVLVRGGGALVGKVPRLRRVGDAGEGEAFRLERPGKPPLELAAEALVTRLARPRPWG